MAYLWTCSFVGLGEDPGVLAIRAPELFGVSLVNWLFVFWLMIAFFLPSQMIADTYPHVVRGVPR